MKQVVALLTAVVLIALTSCRVEVVEVAPAYGPNGLDGRAYFGIDYDYKPPYSYWDDNYNIPVDPYFREYYRTNPGIFEFEYFVNRTEYWYGTYEIWVNPGEPGRPYGEPGLDGRDTYLMLICNPEGPYEFRKNAEVIDFKETEDGFVEYTQIIEQAGIKVRMKKTTTAERLPKGKEPKFIQK